MFYHIYVSINFHKDVNIDRIGSMFYVTLFTGMLYLSTVLNGVAQKTEQIIIIIYLLTYLLTYLLNHSLTDWSTHSLTHSLTYLLTHLLTDWLTHLLTHSLTH